MPEAKKCPWCGCTLSLVPLFSSYAEECSTCPRGPIPFKVQGSRIGAKGSLIGLIKQFGIGFVGLFTGRATGTKYFVQPTTLSPSTDAIFCTLTACDGTIQHKEYPWPANDATDEIEIIG